MNHPKIGDAKQVVERRQAVAGIVILFYNEAKGGANYGLASYGVDKARCLAVGYVVEQIAQRLEMRLIDVPDLSKGK